MKQSDTPESFFSAFRRYRRLEVTICTAAAIIGFPCLLLTVLFKETNYLIGCGVGVVLNQIGLYFGERMQRRISDLAGAGIEAIGPLAESLDYDLDSDPAEEYARRHYWRGGVLASLRKLLAEAPTIHLLSLNDSEAKSLYRCLDPIWSAHESAFQVILLDRLAQFPDSRALHNVSKLADAVHLTTRAKRAQSKAEHVRPLLEAQARHDQSAAALLCPSQPTPSTNLLRPHAHHEDSGELELLRPAVNNSDSA